MSKLVHFLIPFLMTLQVSAQTSVLDKYLDSMKTDFEHSPFTLSGTKASQHPLYSSLLSFAKKINSKVVWATSVSGHILNLPFHPQRMVVKPQDEFDGWFDEFTTPNLIVVHKKAPLIILIHELRHAVHLGGHPIISGNWFDQTLQRNEIAIDQYKEKIQNSTLHPSTKKRLIKLSTRLLETCSEISAHTGDLRLAEAFQHESAQSYLEFIQDYKKEFLVSYEGLMNHPASLDEPFIENLNGALQKFMNQNDLN